MISYPFYKNLLSGDHILIAGRTGSGKSVIENALIYHILLTRPEDRLLLIDPKIVEVDKYRPARQCIGYADTTAAAADLLEKALVITEQRYREMKRQNLSTWNGSRLYVIVDELNDLLTTGKKQIYPQLLRIAQIGRAAGVVLVCCTQSPKRDIIPSNLRCNFGVIVGLKTTTKQDSRNIIEISDLITLPGKYGNAIVLDSNGYTTYTNIPMISDTDINAIIQLYRPKKRKKLFGIF